MAESGFFFTDHRPSGGGFQWGPGNASVTSSDLVTSGSSGSSRMAVPETSGSSDVGGLASSWPAVATGLTVAGAALSYSLYRYATMRRRRSRNGGARLNSQSRGSPLIQRQFPTGKDVDVVNAVELPRPEVGVSSSAAVHREYEKLELLGKGGFGSVYKGRHRRSGTLVAIKVVPLGESDELATEFTLLKSLSHPHIVRIVGFATFKQEARLYLEWVPGGSLSDLLQNYGAVSEALLRSYTRQILLGMYYLHSNGILHRDIKPRNILVDASGLLKLTDFGLSRHIDSLGTTTKLCGTPVYMAPEVFHGHFSVGSDIWGLGCTLVELVTGQPPWSDINIARNREALIFFIGSNAGKDNHRPTIPDGLSDVVKDFLGICFAPNAADRSTCAKLLRHPFVQPLTTSEPLSPTAHEMGSSPLSTSPESTF